MTAMQDEQSSSSADTTATADDHHSGSGSSSQEVINPPPLSATITVTMRETTTTGDPTSASSSSTTTNSAVGGKDDHSTDNSSGSEPTTTTSSTSSTFTNDHHHQHFHNHNHNHHQSQLSSEVVMHPKLSPPKDLPGLKSEKTELVLATGKTRQQQLEPPLAEVVSTSSSVQASSIRTLASIADNGNGSDTHNLDDSMNDDSSYYNKLPHWSQNVTELVSVATTGVLIAGGSDYGQWPYFTETGDIILEIDNIQVAGYTSGDIEEILRRGQTHNFRLVASNLGLPLELREYLNRRFERGSLDHKLQEVIRQNIYARTIPCTTRPPRAGEVDEVDYKFLSVEAFTQMERAGLLLESGLYQGYHYGTPLPVSNLSNSKSNSDAVEVSTGINGDRGNNNNSQQLASSQLSLVAKRKRNRSNLAAIDASSLPYGWERISDAHYGVYYIDHINKRTQYERPYECELIKGVSGFGFTLVEIDRGLVVVKSLIQGGAAQASGVIASGDVLVSVAGVAVSGLQHSDIAHLFTNFNVGDRVKLTFARGFQLPSGFNEEDYDIITLKIVKGTGGFGFTISEGHNGQKVKKILDLERCCSLRQGDILLNINGIDLTTLMHHDVVETLKKCPLDTPTEFIIKRKKSRYSSNGGNGHFTTQPKSSPLPMDDGEERQPQLQAPITGKVLQPMDNNVIVEAACPNNNIYQKSGGPPPPPPLEAYYQQQQATAAAVYGKLNGANGDGGNTYNEYIIEETVGDGSIIGTLYTANGSAVGPAVITTNTAPTGNSEYANSGQQYYSVPHYGSVASLQLTNGGNGHPIYGSQYGEYAYQMPVTLKTQTGLESPSSGGGGVANFDTSSYDPIDYEYLQVTLSRNENGFGFRIIGGSEEGSNVAIGSIVIGGAAFKDGVLKAGDEIISINETNVVGSSHQEVVQLMSQTGPAVRIVIRRKKYFNVYYDVTLYRHDYEGFGFVIISCGNCALIGRIIENSPAHRCQRLHIRDRIIAVNGTDVTNLSHPEIVNKIKESGDTLHLRIIPGDSYTVELIRGPNGYGFSIRGGSEYNGMPLFILAIAPNGPATSLLTVGDEILEINDFPTTGLTHSEAVRLISQGGPSVKLRLRRNLTAGGLNDLFPPANGGNVSPPFSPSGSFIGRVGTPTTATGHHSAQLLSAAHSPTHPSQVPFTPLQSAVHQSAVSSANIMIGKGAEFLNY